MTVTNDCDPSAVSSPLTLVFSGISPTCNGVRTATKAKQVVVDPDPNPQPQPADPGQPQDSGQTQGAGGTSPLLPPARPGLNLTNVAADRYCIGTRRGAGKDLTLRYTLNDAARMTFTIQRRTKPFAAPRKVCPVRKPGGPGPIPVTFGDLGSARLDSAKGENFTTVDTGASRAKAAAVAVTAGRARLRLTQVLGGRKLSPGWYRVLLQGTRADGSRSQIADVKFWVLRP